MNKTAATDPEWCVYPPCRHPFCKCFEYMNSPDVSQYAVAYSHLSAKDRLYIAQKIVQFSVVKKADAAREWLRICWQDYHAERTFTGDRLEWYRNCPS